MKFSIITPSFRSSNWLKLCIASVVDQEGVEVEHIVQDSCSDDETRDWLPRDRRVRAFIEKDDGMYDAINRGYRRAQGDILAYLNCDEQYLPGALKAVQGFFDSHPEIEVALAGAVVVDENSHYLCHRQALAPNLRHIWFRFSALTCSVFLRRSVIEQRGIYFDPHWRASGDCHWFIALLKSKVRMAVFDEVTSAFTDNGENLGLQPEAIREMSETLALAPRWVLRLKPVWILQHRLKRLALGHFWLKPTSYSIYTLQSPDRRVRFDVPKPTAVWWNRLQVKKPVVLPR